MIINLSDKYDSLCHIYRKYRQKILLFHFNGYKTTSSFEKYLITMLFHAIYSPHQKEIIKSFTKTKDYKDFLLYNYGELTQQDIQEIKKYLEINENNNVYFSLQKNILLLDKFIPNNSQINNIKTDVFDVLLSNFGLYCPEGYTSQQFLTIIYGEELLLELAKSL